MLGSGWKMYGSCTPRFKRKVRAHSFPGAENASAPKFWSPGLLGAGGLSIKCWDVGGSDKIRPLWRHYTRFFKGLIFMVDANDRDRVTGETRDELHRILADCELRAMPVLIIANKMDLPNALRPQQVRQTPPVATTVRALSPPEKLHVQAAQRPLYYINIPQQAPPPPKGNLVRTVRLTPRPHAASSTQLYRDTGGAHVMSVLC